MCAKSRDKAPWGFVSFENPPDQLPCQHTILDGDLAHHLGTVMRLRLGDPLVVVDEARSEAYEASLETISAKSFTVTLSKKRFPSPVPTPLWAVVSLIKEQRWDWMLQKLTELGVTDIVPLQAHRSVVHPGAKSKDERWQKILRQAAQQSEHVRLPKLHPVTTLLGLEALLPPGALKLAALERTGHSVLSHLGSGQSASAMVFAVGPEGGWTSEEVETLQSLGFQGVGLGQAILRAETAAILLAGLLRHGH